MCLPLLKAWGQNGGMRNILTTLFLIVLAPVLIGFFVANRESVTISFDPSSLENPALAFDVPLFIGLAGTLGIGFVLGAIGMWISNTRLRHRSGQARRKIRELERELALAKAAATEPASGGTNLPALRT
ncbi:MAG: LapA family protein [Pseudomonadota bacterium]